MLNRLTTLNRLLISGWWLVLLGAACQIAPAVTVAPTVAPTLPLSNETQALTTLHLVTGEFEPFSGEALPNKGLASEVAVLAFERAGYRVDLAFLPWPRGYNETLALTYFGTFPYSKNPDREKDFLYSEPLYTYNGAFFVRPDSTLQFSGVENLANLHMCAPVGFSTFIIQKQLDDGTIQLDRPEDLAACFKMLDARRTEMVMTIEDVGWAVVDKEFNNRVGFKVLGRLESSDFLIVSKTYPKGEQILHEFNQALAALQAEGVIKQLILKHLQ